MMEIGEDTEDHSRILPEGYVPTPWDVICQRGKDCYTHVGNQRFRVCIDNNLKTYMTTTARNDKTSIVNAIVDSFYQSAATVGGCGFIRRDETSQRWHMVADKVAREKVGQALRDAVKVARKKSISTTTKRTAKKSADGERKSSNIDTGDAQAAIYASLPQQISTADVHTGDINSSRAAAAASPSTGFSASSGTLALSSRSSSTTQSSSDAGLNAAIFQNTNDSNIMTQSNFDQDQLSPVQGNTGAARTDLSTSQQTYEPLPFNQNGEADSMFIKEMIKHIFPAGEDEKQAAELERTNSGIVNAEPKEDQSDLASATNRPATMAPSTDKAEFLFDPLMDLADEEE